MLSVNSPPVLFLDVDGVLHPSEGPGMDALGPTFEKQQMQLLKYICHSVEGGVKIVLTSNWRKYPALKRMLENELIDCGITGPLGIFDCTEVMNRDRRIEICQWLKNHEPSTFVIIDDLNLNDDSSLPPGTIWKDAGIYQHFVCTDFATGLTQDTADKCIEIIRNKVWNGISPG